MSDDYVFTLGDKALKKAKKELNEDPKQRMSAVETFRAWILSQKHIKCDTDTAFLLPFLRVAKFSQLKARERLENYLQIFDKYPKWTRNIDTHDEKLKAFLKSGYVCYGVRDDNGCLINYAVMANMDIHGDKYSKDDLMRGLIATTCVNIIEEEQQIHGQIFFEDTSGFTMKHQTYFGMEDSRKSMQMWQNSFPARFKGFHFYNVGPLLETLFNFVRPVLSKKWAERFQFHSTLESVYKKIPKKCLPVEYLPDDYDGPNAGKLQDLIDATYERLTSPEMRERVLHLTDPECFHIDMKAKDKSEPQASFRKLNID